MTKQKSIHQQLADKTFNELGIDPKTGKPIRDAQGKLLSSRKPPISSHILPFRIPVLEKTKRQASSTTGYKASASWQTASLLRDLLTFWFKSQPPVNSLNLPLYSRLKAQILDASRSVVANIEEGWSRPSTKEYLDFLGFSQASLAEVRGDLERMLSDRIILSAKNPVSYTLKSIGIPTPSRNFPYPPVNSRRNPGKYGNLRAKLREYTGKEIKSSQLTYENFIELINKTDYLLKRAVEGLDKKIISDEKQKLNSQLSAYWRKHW